MSQVILAFRWYIVVQVFGLAALPLCARLFRHLPDRGYGVSKPLGLLLAGWAFWLLTTFGLTHNTVGGILVALTLLFSAGIALRMADQSSAQTFIPPSTILITEAVFTLAFVACCLVRAGMPQIQTAGGEKWMEIAFLRAILRSDTFPPHDPWLSGFAISYYYFGYIIVAMLTRLAAIPPSIAFNLGVATLFALTCTGAFSLVYNLLYGGRNQVFLQAQRQKPGFFTALGALFAPLLVAVMGNLEGLLEVLHARGIGPHALLTWLDSRGIGPVAFWAWLDVRSIDGPPPAFADGSWTPPRFFWWWQASRVLRDYDLRGAAQEVIDEFPAFSFLLGDMHPHVLALPFVLLALALALNLYFRIVITSREQTENGNDKDEIDDSQPPTRNSKPKTQNSQFAIRNSQFLPWEFLVYAICLGGLGFLNTWDFPIYLFVIAAAYALALLRTPHASRITDCLLRTAKLAFAFLLAGILLYLPFWIGFQSQAGGILINPFNGTRLPHFLIMFGPLFFIAAAFVAVQVRREGIRAYRVLNWTAITALSIVVLLALVLGLVALLAWLDLVPSQGPASYVVAWLRGAPIPYLENLPNAHTIISQRLLQRLYSPWTTLGLVALIVSILLIVLKPVQKRTQDEQATVVVQDSVLARNFALLLLATGALLILSVEYVYLRDNFGTRMNTVFKFYFQAWVLWAVGGAYALARFLRRGSRGSTMIAGIAVLLIVAGLIYPAFAIPARDGEQGGARTLDGAAYLADVHPDDYAAIAWLNENVSGTPVILETPGGGYDYEGRVSAHTGLPTLLGWAGHEGQWRGNYDEQNRREPDIESLYSSTNPALVLDLLDKYGIQYVYVGPTERARYPAAGLAKFAAMLEPVYDSGAVTIYRYTPSRMSNHE